MSVINRMLSQLDARRAPAPEATGTATAGSIEAVSVAAPRRLGLVVLAGAALVSAAAFGQWPALMGGRAFPLPHPAMVSQPAVATESTVQMAATQIESVPAAEVEAPLTEKPTSVESAPLGALSPEGRGSWPVHIAPPSRSAKVAAEVPPPTAADTIVAMAAPVKNVASAPAPATDPSSVEKRVIPPSPSQRAAFAYRQALDNAASGHSHPAIALALEALQTEPDHLAARELAAVLMIESKRLGDAAALMREGLERQPQQPRLTMLLARIDAETGAPQTALDRLAAAPALDAEGHGLRAALLTRAERFREAASAYEAAVRLQPDNAAWWFGLGVALEANGQAPLARQALQRARAIGSLRGDALAYIEQKLASRE